MVGYENCCTYPCSILRVVVSPINRQRRPPPNSDLLHIGHQVVGDSKWVVPDVATRVSVDRVEVPQQYDLLVRVRALEVMEDVFNDKLHKQNHQQEPDQILSMYLVSSHTREISLRGEIKQALLLALGGTFVRL